MSDELLFPSDLLEGNIQDSVPAGYILRPLARDDHRKGFFECLQSLTWTGDVSEQRYQKHLDWLRNSSPGWFYCLVIEHEGEIVATGVVIAGRKFIWDLGMVGHIEDVSVLKEYQGRGLGKLLLRALNVVAEKIGCLKTILNCSEEKEGFYVKCGYESGGLQMSRKFEGVQTDGSSSEE